MIDQQGLDPAGRLWLALGWMLVALVCLGMVRRRNPSVSPAPLDPCLWALGLMGITTLVPALLLEVGRIVLYPREWAFILASFPLVWFVAFGGGSSLLVTTSAGFNPSRDEGGTAWMCVVAVQALVVATLVAAGFSRAVTGPRPLTGGLRVLRLLVVANSVLGFLPLMSIILDD